MKIYTLDETTYPGVPMDVGPEVQQTNKFCDPQVCVDTYREHLEEWVLGEELGFDGALTNEHHFTYFNINPSSTILTTALIARTKRMKVGVIGHVLPLRHPIQTAEEFIQMDVLSNGRFIGGIVRGVPQEYVSYNVDAFTSKERFQECYDIIQKCLTEEIFDYEGKFFKLRAVSVWPRPVQKPIPMWMPAGSADTLDFAAKNHIAAAQVWSPTLAWKEPWDYYRKLAKEKYGWTPSPENFVGARYIHVAETNEKAIEECRDAVMYIRRLASFSRPVQVSAPVAGIQTDRSFEYRQNPNLGMPGPGTPFEKLREAGFIVCGDPDYVADWLAEDIKVAGYGHLLCMFRVGSNKHENVINSKKLFAKYVMPKLKPIWAEAPQKTTSEAKR